MSPETGVTTLCGYLNQVPAAKFTCLLSNWGWAMPLTVLVRASDWSLVDPNSNPGWI